AEAEISVPNIPGISKASFLRLILDQVPTWNADFLVRPNVIEITTGTFSIPEYQFIEGNFEDMPLEKVLMDLSDRTVLRIFIDARDKDKAKTPISDRFQHETNLATAVRLLADMADLKVMVVDRVLYVTLTSNTTEFPPGRVPSLKPIRQEGA